MILLYISAQAPDITKEQLLEILAFNNDKFVEALNNQRVLFAYFQKIDTLIFNSERRNKI